MVRCANRAETAPPLLVSLQSPAAEPFKNELPRSPSGSMLILPPADREVDGRSRSASRVAGNHRNDRAPLLASRETCRSLPGGRAGRRITVAG